MNRIITLITLIALYCFICISDAESDLETLYEKKPTSVGIDFVSLPKGAFKRSVLPKDSKNNVQKTKGGSDRIVEISAFMMSASEISWKQWQDIVGKTGAERVFFRLYGRALGDDDLDFPVTGVNYFEISRFCDLLTIRLKTDDGFTGKAFLPTEAQWEYVAKCGFSGNRDENMRRKNSANLKMNKCKSGKPNKYGIFDILGNVSEFSRDVYIENLSGGKNPKNVSSGDVNTMKFVVRGGSFLKDKSCAKPTYRVPVMPDYSSIDTGFRVVWEGMDIAPTR